MLERSCAAIHVHYGRPDQPVIVFVLQAGEEDACSPMGLGCPVLRF